MATITNEDEFKAWLEGKPREVAVVLAARVALRVLPLVGIWNFGEASGQRGLNSLLLSSMRAAAIALANINYPHYREVLRVAGAAENAASPNQTFPSISASIAEVASSATMLASGAFLHENAIAHAVEAAHAAARAANFIRGDAPVRDSSFGVQIWQSIQADAELVEYGALPITLSKIHLWDGNIWPGLMPPFLEGIWSNLRAELLSADHDWEVWIDWYLDRLYGKAEGDEDLALFRTTLNEEADWAKGPAHVNALIKARIEEHRARQTHKPTNVRNSAKPSTQNSQPPEAKTALGKIVIGDAQSLIEKIDLLREAIDLRREDLESHKPNTDEDYAAWKIEHDNVLDLAERVQALEKSVRDFLDCQGPEEAIEPAVVSFSNSLKAWWSKHDQQVINSAWRFGRKAGKVAVIVTSAGVGASFGMAFATTPVAIALMGGDKLIEQINKLKLPKWKS